MKDFDENIQSSQVLAGLVSSLLVYWNNNECFFTDRRFSYYQRKNIELDYDTAENLALNFSEKYFPDKDELIRFVDGLYERWMISNNIKKHYENFLDLIKEISSNNHYFDIFCLFANQHDEDFCFCEDFYEREDRTLRFDKYLVDGEILFEDNEIIFNDFDFSHLEQKTKALIKKESIEEANPLESLLEQLASDKKAKKLTNIFKNLMDSEHDL